MLDGFCADAAAAAAAAAICKKGLIKNGLPAAAAADGKFIIDGDDER